jgi:hypothetical protein
VIYRLLTIGTSCSLPLTATFSPSLPPSISNRLDLDLDHGISEQIIFVPSTCPRPHAVQQPDSSSECFWSSAKLDGTLWHFPLCPSSEQHCRVLDGVLELAVVKLQLRLLLHYPVRWGCSPESSSPCCSGSPVPANDPATATASWRAPPYWRMGSHCVEVPR